VKRQKKLSVSISAWAWSNLSKASPACTTSPRSSAMKARSSSELIGCTAAVWLSTNLLALKILVASRFPTLKTFSSIAVSTPRRALPAQ
jgi:hypothetical protein